MLGIRVETIEMKREHELALHDDVLLLMNGYKSCQIN
jgi:hypothetical protein